MVQGRMKEHGVVKPVALHGEEASRQRWYPVLIDAENEGMITTDAECYIIHQGNMYETWAYDATLANDEAIILATPVPCDEIYHFTFTAACSAQSTLELLENPGVDEGTLQDIYNMNRNFPDMAGAMLLNPTLAGGTVLIKMLVPGGSGPRAVGGTGTSKVDLHWMTNPARNYAVRLTNISGQTQSASLSLNFYFGNKI